MSKVAVVGSRSFIDYQFLEQVLNTYSNIEVIISGGASGTDSLAGIYAKKYNIPLKVFFPNWDEYGKRAGAIRNKEIVDACDEVIAFYNGTSKGTKITIDLANKANKKVTIIKV